MPHQPNWQEFGDKVGQDKPKHEPVTVYDDHYGRYEEQKPHVGGSGTPVGEPNPFSISGGTK